MTPQFLGDEARAEASRVVAYAMDHPYRPGANAPSPGGDPGHVATFDTYRAVFSFTEYRGVTYRQISVSDFSKDLPHRATVFAIADLFGFTGWDRSTLEHPPQGWDVWVGKAERCVLIAQQIA